MEEQTQSNKLKGLGGWLIIFTIGILTSIPIMLMDLIEVLSAYYENWSTITTPGSAAYSPWWAPTIIFEVTGNFILLSGAIYSAYLYFNKKSLFPRIYIGLLLYSALLTVLDNIMLLIVFNTMTHSIADWERFFPLRDILRTFIIAAIWIPYMLVSKRVKATFVED